ncbi:MAG: response regulator [Acidobacteriota bacterium]
MPRPTILVVDDNEIVREITCQVLDDAGYRAVPLSNAFALTQAILDHRPELILLDVRMPALSGEKATQILRQRRFSRDIPIVFYSELDEAELERLVAETGASGHLRKQPGARGVVEAVEAWVDRPTAVV